jgi:hypothetical protein
MLNASFGCCLFLPQITFLMLIVSVKHVNEQHVSLFQWFRLSKPQSSRRPHAHGANSLLRRGVGQVLIANSIGGCPPVSDTFVLRKGKPGAIKCRSRETIALPGCFRRITGSICHVCCTRTARAAPFRRPRSIFRIHGAGRASDESCVRSQSGIAWGKRLQMPTRFTYLPEQVHFTSHQYPR